MPVPIQGASISPAFNQIPRLVGTNAQSASLSNGTAAAQISNPEVANSGNVQSVVQRGAQLNTENRVTPVQPQLGSILDVFA